MTDSFEITASLDWRPRYEGTSHEDATARAMGFRAALLPGVFVYGHATRPALRRWGRDWLARGTADVRFRRPVHAGDSLRVLVGADERRAGEIIATVSIMQVESGTVVLEGTVGLADAPPTPPDLPLLDPLEPRRVIHPGAVPEGLALGSVAQTLTAETVAESRADFRETEPILAEDGLIHSGCLIRKTMGDALGNLILPMPVIFAAVRVENMAPAPVGASYRTSARITRGYEARGKHFIETDEWLLADGRPVARHVRQNVYAMETP
jgi:hypothetical protein